ncbi:TPA: hypothetical protein DCQ44_03270 [Candidatus Taylorbacteria bacterium]|nr:hypothetical protein [Candidatus Taylorbacteria bacterium]
MFVDIRFCGVLNLLTINIRCYIVPLEKVVFITGKAVIMFVKTIKEGKDFEAAFFGFNHPFIYKEFQPIEEVLSDVVASQKRLCWNPKHPTTPMTRRLFEPIKLGLGVGGEALQLFCAINTILDYHFGIDGFFSISKRSALKFTVDDIVTFDLTFKSSSHKKKNQKADFLISAADFESLPNLGYLVDKIVRKLRKDCL